MGHVIINSENILGGLSEELKEKMIKQLSGFPIRYNDKIIGHITYMDKDGKIHGEITEIDERNIHLFNNLKEGFRIQDDKE